MSMIIHWKSFKKIHVMKVNKSLFQLYKKFNFIIICRFYVPVQRAKPIMIFLFHFQLTHFM